jgi:2-iminobutanoate/2-iminopropanoate deaminase
MRKAISTDGAPKPAAPFSQGTDAGSTVYVSGQLGIDPATGELPAEMGAETRRLLQNIEAVLQAAGLTMDDVTKTLIFLTDFDDYAAMNEAYLEFFPVPHPARSTVKVAGLLAGARVEIEAIAVRTG